jgi:RNA polymerase-interacting CarD/CdnL/TRCF family regulator
MILGIGNKVIYPSQGPCQIGRIVTRVIDGTPIEFYHLIVLAEGGGELYVPLDKAQAIGIRLLLDKSEIPELLGHLKKTATTADHWKLRADYNSKMTASGSAYDLAEVVESLTELRDTKALTLGESRMLERARRLLIGEISEVMGETKQEAEQQVDIALRAQKEKAEPGLVIKKGLVNEANLNIGRKEAASQANRKAQKAGIQSI